MYGAYFLLKRPIAVVPSNWTRLIETEKAMADTVADAKARPSTIHEHLSFVGSQEAIGS